MPRGITKSRYLTLLEVADLYGVEPELPRRLRRQRVWRMFRSFELRDGVRYLHQSGTSTSPTKVCIDDLHLLDPWEPNTIQRLREDLDALAIAHNNLKRRVSPLEDFAEKASDWMRQQVAQTDSLLARKPVH